MNDYREFFATTATIGAGLWLVYGTIMLYIASNRLRALTPEVYLYWTPVVSALQGGAFFAVAMFVSLSRLVPQGAFVQIVGVIDFIAWWFIAAPVAVAFVAWWRIFRSATYAFNKQHASFGLGVSLASAWVIGSALRLTDLVSIAKDTIWLLALGLVVATLGFYNVFRIMRAS